MISKTVQQKLGEINKIRNRYVHAEDAETKKEDAKKCIDLLRELITEKFDLRNFYDMVEGKLVLKKRYRKA